MYNILKIFVVSWLVLAASGPGALAGECPAAQEAFTSQDLDTARDEVERCLSVTPNDSEILFLRARILAGQGNFQGALSTLEILKNQEPGNLDYMTMYVRFTAWSGDTQAALAALELLGDKVYGDPESSRLNADVLRWADSWTDAAAAYREHLVRYPDDETARKSLVDCLVSDGNREEALAEAGTWCLQFPEGEGCERLAGLKAEDKRFSLFIQPGYTFVRSRPDWWQTSATFMHRATDRLTWNVGALLMGRDFGTGQNLDVYLSGGLGLGITRNFGVNLGAGASVAPDYLPIWTAQIEPWVSTDFGLYLALRYWRMEFDSGGVDIINPTLDYYFGPFMAELKYYFSLDAGNDPGHSVLGRLVWFPANSSLYVGGGFGDKSDYLTVRQFESDSFWLLLVGGSTRLNSSNQLMLDYVFRDETAGLASWQAHEFLLGWLFNF